MRFFALPFLLLLILTCAPYAQPRWTKVLGAPKYGVSSLVAFPGNPDTMYAIGDAFYRSIDGGRVWETVAAESSRQGPLKVGRTHANILYVWVAAPDGGYNMKVSADGGQTWKQTLGRLSGWVWTPPVMWLPPFIETDVLNDSIAYVSGGGNYKSTNGGVTWEGLPALPLGSRGRFFYSEASPSELYIVSGKDVLRNGNPEEEWSRWRTFPQRVLSLAFDPYDPKIMYVLTDELTGNPYYSTYLYFTYDQGEYWEMTRSEQYFGSDVPMFMAVNPATRDLFIGLRDYPWYQAIGYGRLLMRSTNRGKSWKALNEGLPPHGCATSLVFDTARGTMVLSIQEPDSGGGIYVRDIVTGVENADEPRPASFTLHQNYPNPFNPQTTIDYDVPHRSHIRLDVVNVLGQVVRVLVNGEMEAGSQSVVFDGAGLPSGVYLARMKTNGAGSVAARKMVLME